MPTLIIFYSSNHSLEHFIYFVCVFFVFHAFFFVQTQRVRFASLRERGNIFGEKNVNENKLRKEKSKKDLRKRRHIREDTPRKRKLTKKEMENEKYKKNFKKKKKKSRKREKKE